MSARGIGLGVLFGSGFVACTIWNGVTLPSTGDASASDASTGDASGYATEVLAARPMAYWRFGAIEAPARLVRDESGHDRHCTASAGVTLDRGPASGMSAVRLGADDDLDCTGDPAFAFGALAPFTFESFVVHDEDGARGAAELRFLFDRVAGASPSDRVGYYAFLSRAANAVDWSVALQRWSGASQMTNTATRELPELGAGKWAHVVFTHDGSGTLAVYVNGALRVESTVVALPVPNAVSLVFGHNQNRSCCALAGRLAEVAIYDRALDATTVERHYLAAFPK